MGSAQQAENFLPRGQRFSLVSNNNWVVISVIVVIFCFPCRGIFPRWLISTLKLWKCEISVYPCNPTRISSEICGNSIHSHISCAEFCGSTPKIPRVCHSRKNFLMQIWFREKNPKKYQIRFIVDPIYRDRLCK
ncbi:hypothetical protein C1646_666111 [Rhizophagus diaphanus]|nr:hypothetical protein C1646_666111 [Rhizophagus diaphanus] [Rhizophagus sp. MUCL 43196]